jgi:hypothetical protein
MISEDKEHTNDLLDLYAGMAMMALIIRGKPLTQVIDASWELAFAMVDERNIKERNEMWEELEELEEEKGIAGIIPPKKRGIKK